MENYDIWILGDNFLRNYMSIFDQEDGNARVGLVGATIHADPSLTFVIVTTYISVGLMGLSIVAVGYFLYRHKAMQAAVEEQENEYYR